MRNLIIDLVIPKRCSPAVAVPYATSSWPCIIPVFDKFGRRYIIGEYFSAISLHRYFSETHTDLEIIRP